MRLRAALTLGLVAGLVAGIVTAYLFPPIDDFDPSNPFWNGLSRLSSELDLTPISSLTSGLAKVDPSRSALLIVGPEAPFSRAEARAVSRFVRGGGLLLLADDFGSGNQLLKLMGLKVRITEGLLLDPLFKHRASPLPKVRARGLKLVLNYAAALAGSGFEVLAESSSFSFLDSNLNLRFDSGERKGPFPVAARVPYGAGEVVVVSDSSLFLNSMLGLGDNLRFARALVGGRGALLDAGHWRRGALASFKGAVRSALTALRAPEARYFLLVGALTLIYAVRLELAEPGGVSAVEEVLRRHPDWDREVLERLEDELGGQRR